MQVGNKCRPAKSPPIMAPALACMLVICKHLLTFVHVRVCVQALQRETECPRLPRALHSHQSYANRIAVACLVLIRPLAEGKICAVSLCAFVGLSCIATSLSFVKGKLKRQKKVIDCVRCSSKPIWLKGCVQALVSAAINQGCAAGLVVASLCSVFRMTARQQRKGSDAAGTKSCLISHFLWLLF